MLDLVNGYGDKRGREEEREVDARNGKERRLILCFKSAGHHSRILRDGRFQDGPKVGRRSQDVQYVRLSIPTCLPFSQICIHHPKKKN